MNKRLAAEILDRLDEHYPAVECPLKYNTVFQLLVAVILSARCRDERVNEVTGRLFENYGTPEAVLELGKEGLISYIRPCGLYVNKAENILSTCRDLLDRFGGEVPGDVQSLRSLAGVGRKTANVVYSQGFGGSAIAVDTHVFRLAGRLGFCETQSVLETEKQLMKYIDQSRWSKAHLLLITHGKRVCYPHKPDCANCFLQDVCKYYAKHENL